MAIETKGTMADMLKERNFYDTIIERTGFMPARVDREDDDKYFVVLLNKPMTHMYAKNVKEVVEAIEELRNAVACR